jgi:hypothetical protein
MKCTEEAVAAAPCCQAHTACMRQLQGHPTPFLARRGSVHWSGLGRNSPVQLERKSVGRRSSACRLYSSSLERRFCQRASFRRLHVPMTARPRGERRDLHCGKEKSNSSKTLVCCTIDFENYEGLRHHRERWGLHDGAVFKT